MRILIISCSHSDASRSRQLADAAAISLTKLGVQIERVDARDLTSVWVSDADLDKYPPEYATLFASAQSADGIVFCFPIYNYSPSSGVKVISEIIGDALDSKPVCFLAASGRRRSFLAVGELMASMLFEQDTVPFSKTLVVSKEESAEDGSLRPETFKAVAEIVSAFLPFVLSVTLYRAERSGIRQGSANIIMPELYVSTLDEHVNIFCDCLGFTLRYSEPGFAELKLGLSSLLLNASAADVPGHLFNNRLSPTGNGIGCEIAIVVDNVDECFRNISKPGLVRSLSEIKDQDWGMRDFRFLTPDNYYIRVSSPRRAVDQE